MNGSALVTNLKASWGLILVIVMMAGGFFLNDNSFRTHMADREIAVDKSIAKIVEDMDESREKLQELREKVHSSDRENVRISTTISHMEKELESVSIRVDEILSELRRR